MEFALQAQTLKRSNAVTGKLRKDHISSVGSHDWTAGNVKLARALKYARKQDEKKEKREAKKIEKASRQNSFESSRHDGPSADVVFQTLPVGSFATSNSDPSISSGRLTPGASCSSAAKVAGDTKTKRWCIFGRKKEDCQRPVDNFTKWDGTDRERRAYAASGSADLLVDALLNMASPSDDPSKKRSRNEHEEEARAQCVSAEPLPDAEQGLEEAILDNAILLERLAGVIGPAQTQLSRRRPHRQHTRDGDHSELAPPPGWAEVLNLGSTRRLHPISIRDIDWSQVDGDEVQEIIKHFEEDRRCDASPTDSGIDMGGDERPVNKGKARALSVSSRGTYHSIVDLEDTAAQEALRNAEDLELHRKQALAQVLGLEYKKVRQEEEDAKHARQLQEDERIAQELQDEEERIAAELASRRECVCCGDEKHVLDFPVKPATNVCQHVSTTCIDCMHSWLSSELDTKGCEDLKCPECPGILAYDSIHLLSNRSTSTKYEQLLLRNTLSSLPEFAWCLSPTCESGQLNTQNGNYMECDTSLGGCGYKQCLLHKVPWHAGETCPQYEHRVSGRKAAEEEAATNAMLDEVSKICPGKNCGWRIQKSTGCDHMTCRKCKWQFCWECLASHKEIKREGNTAHERWCKFHSENLEKGESGRVEVSWPFNVHA
ncbi:hypothetical protein DOTSEDRAFT_55051 [Dothistroma septosporum NZE10]|uniref:RBR-type E3 ubiquitin transferase n=1 Tax=Dothistroma septosporum (strain NZE10 / CBS 128990) TaxID=675120 RepID=N1PHW6_DOTSN|nr:hypothetical protein DOTSEDRAFT_55051 [Dothistroma septosporum NZE10]